MTEKKETNQEEAVSKKADDKISKPKYTPILTERDLKILAFLFRVKFATQEQLGKYTGSTVQAMKQRLFWLKKGEYVDAQKILMNTPLVYYPGIKARLGHEIQKYREKVNIPWRTMNHSLVVNDVILRLLIDDKMEEDMITTEREIMAEVRGGNIPGLKPKLPARRIPDIIVTTKGSSQDRLTAIEVELTKKNAKDMTAVFAHYLNANAFYTIIYLCDTETIAKYVRTEAKKLNKKIIEVHTLESFFQSGLKLLEI